MSEFIAEAQVLIVPNTAAFAASLRGQVEAAVAKAGPIAIPVIAAPAAGAAASAEALVAAQQDATAATLGLSSATGLETEALDLAAKAQLDAAAASQIAGAAATAEATEIARLTVAENAAAVAFRKSEAVALAAVGTTTELSAARATLKAATSSVVASELAFDAALATTSAGHKNAAAAELAEARALQVSAQAAFDSAVAHRADTAAVIHSAEAHRSLEKGVVATTAGMAGLRGATLAASFPFIAGAAAAIVFSKSIKEASDEVEQLNKVAVVFGSSGQQIEDFAKTTATSLGISTTQALEAAGVFGNLFRTIKISEPIAADMSQRLVELASDLASFNNASPERTLEAIRSGLVGQARPLRVFGIFLSAARVQQEALIETGKKSITQLTEAEKVQARYTLILRDSNIAAGDFARTSDRLANQSRILKAQISDLQATIGRALVPALSTAVGILSDYITTVARAGTATNDFVNFVKDLTPATKHAGPSVEDLEKHVAKLYFRFVVLGPVISAADFALNHFVHTADEADKKQSGFHFASSLAAAIAAIKATAEQADLGKVASQLSGLEVQGLKIQTGLAPGGRGAEEANLRKQITDQKKIVSLTASGTKARREALQTLKQKQDELAALEEQDAQDARDRASKIKAAAAKAKAAARAAAQAQQEATQAFIDSFSGRQQQLQNKLTDAQIFGSAQQEINLNKQIVKADNAEIHAIQDRIRHLHLHGDALKVARAAIKALQQEIFNTRNAILQLQAERKQALVDARQSHLEAQLAIAETTKSTKDDRAAEKALIAFDKAQIARLVALKKRRGLTLEEAAQLDAFRVDLAQRNKALRDLTEENKKGADAFFKFLQTQQGFAANLLGNLIPGFATGGLVGGSQAAAAGDAGLRQVPGGFEQPRGAVQGQAAIASSRDRGVRPVQVDTTNQLLRQILRSLQNLNGRTQHPEARHNRAVGSAILDTMGGVHGA